MAARTKPVTDEAAAVIARHSLEYREANGLSRRAMAEQMGVSTTQLARLEQAEQLPSITTLARLAGVLGMEIAVSISPDDGAPRLLRKKARSRIVAESKVPAATVRLAALPPSG